MNYILSIEPFLNQYQKQYQNVLTINQIPPGPLAQRVIRINPPKLSPFGITNYNVADKCIFVIRKEGALIGAQEYATVDEMPQMILYLVANGYTIDHQTTELVQRIPVTNRVVCVFKSG
jgi:hypothetical protein